MSSQGQIALQMINAIDFIILFPKICHLFVKDVNLTLLSDEPEKRNDQFVIAINSGDVVSH